VHGGAGAVIEDREALMKTERIVVPIILTVLLFGCATPARLWMINDRGEVRECASYMNTQCAEDLQRVGYVRLPTVRIGVNFAPSDSLVVGGFPVGSPAARAGLQRGDRIVRADDQEVRGRTDIAKVLNSKNPGDTIVLAVDRGGQRVDIPVVVIEETM
jgi:membrane-associated protease RseP (regulator of RpoE activity)